ncbi:hypothetical protein ACSMX9_08200 [Streptomyces sp. LE64]|uniref:hypothetical protein n=1 Tax=Streptomyces sp. LE64 TaxID=3448653 RepID=UPI00404370B7
MHPRRHARYVALLTAVVTIASLLTAVGPAATPVEAAPASASRCAGRPVRTLPLTGGHVTVYKNVRWVCALTVARHPGLRRFMAVGVQVRGSREVVKHGYHSRRSASVTVHAGQRCVRVSGTIGLHERRSGWILC